MAKKQKTKKVERPWQLGPREKVALGSFWMTLARLLTAERTAREWSTVTVEKHGGPSYGIVQEHERGQFRSTRALKLHLNAFGWEETDVFAKAIADEQGIRALEPWQATHLRHLRTIHDRSPHVRDAILELTTYAATAALANHPQAVIPVAEFVAVDQESARKGRAARP